MSRRLQQKLSRLFSAPVPRRARPQRAQREAAYALADELGIELERIQSGVNVWPPAGLESERDPYDGDHYASDWVEALQMLREYEKLACPSGDAEQDGSAVS